ncbi:hypothetical protein [Rhizobium sp. HT1-10]|uniref:hypothetical protein n=1 Tax=Rhizobium sp. HT1-10 TaxID=3111638 RepID=UPI003C23133F
MREFSKVSPLFWRNKRFSALTSTDAKLCMLYFVTCEHQNSAGCYRLPDAYAAADLSWPMQHYLEVRQQLADAGLILFDDESKELFVTDWFETNPAMNDKHSQGCQRLISNIESDNVREAAEDAFLQAEENRQSKPSKAAGSVPNFNPSSRLASTGYLNRRQ